jgi:hypothetical protein
MSQTKYLELVNDYFILTIISRQSLKLLNNFYENGNEEFKEKLDKYPQVFLDEYLNKFKKDSVLLKSIESVKNNIQFLTWLAIISLILSAVIGIFISSN